MHHSYYLYSVLPVFMALPQAHHILPPSQLPVPYRISLHNLSLQRNGEIMIFLQSCHARKDASLTVKWKPKNRKRNVRFRAEDQDNTLRSVHSSFWGYFSFNFLKCTSRVRPNANPFLRQRKSPPACLGTDLQHVPSACVWEPHAWLHSRECECARVCAFAQVHVPEEEVRSDYTCICTTRLCE